VLSVFQVLLYEKRVVDEDAHLVEKALRIDRFASSTGLNDGAVVLCDLAPVFQDYSR
jgi:hypothetical protein